jgi:hypothetical protein
MAILEEYFVSGNSEPVEEDNHYSKRADWASTSSI